MSAEGRRPRQVVILGSTGSIGRQALDIVRRYPGRFRVTGLVARRRAAELALQAAEFRPQHGGVVGPPAAAAGPDGADGPGIRPGTTVYRGPDAPTQVVEAAAPDLVVDAIAGLAGLLPALATLARPGALLAMASKEPMVAAGHLLRQASAPAGSRLVPVDSETTAVAQCLAAVRPDEVARVYITASGGPFWGRDPAELEDVQPCEAIRHPRWAMGPKISVDSATLFNKGLEVLEIAGLFGLPQRKIGILVHPQSVAHAMVELCDGSIDARFGPTDMRVPISQAMFWPERAPDAPARLALDCLRVEFSTPDLSPWPCLRAALCAGADGGTAPAAVSAADEQLVGMFLAGEVTFGDIGRGLWATLRAHRESVGGAEPAAGGAGTGSLPGQPAALAEILEADRWGRSFAREWAQRSAARERGCPPGQVGEDYIA